MLREVGKRDQALLVSFLDRYAGDMPRTMLQLLRRAPRCPTAHQTDGYEVMPRGSRNSARLTACVGRRLVAKSSGALPAGSVSIDFYPVAVGI
jgi:hypothetical protein